MNKRKRIEAMATTFEQQIGAAGDVRELEYISALHQTTTEEVRRDASIKGASGGYLDP